MSAAIDLFGAVYTTQGGTRYHADRACYALANGRGTQAYFAGEWLYGAQSLAGLYPLVRRSTISAQQFSYTACLVCVPLAEALPPLPFVTGQTFGHEPVTSTGLFANDPPACARCVDPGTGWGTRRRRSRPAMWPCTSAAVLGLVVIDADRWNARYPVGTQVLAWPGTRADKPLHTRTRTPAWRLGHGDSVVSVDDYAGGIALTHVEPW
jgi:hypothetical protein